MRDFDPAAILAGWPRFGVDTRVDALCVAVFDHGNAPPGYSDRRFRFDYLADRLAGGRADDLAAFAFLREAIPPDMTRLRAAASLAAPWPISRCWRWIPARRRCSARWRIGAVRGGARGRRPGGQRGQLPHAGLPPGGRRVRGLFEHHTGELREGQLATLLRRLAAGTLTNAEVFDSQGHGALVLEPGGGAACPLCDHRPPPPAALSRAGREQRSYSTFAYRAGDLPWPLHLAMPHGDMMLTGCFALLRALAQHWPPAHPAVVAGLGVL